MSKLKYFKKEGEGLNGKLGYFYFEFEDDYPSKQIEVYENEIVFLDTNHPEKGEHMLGDQSLEFFDFSEDDIISAEDFFKIWDKKS